jgi:hypothetical protein
MDLTTMIAEARLIIGQPDANNSNVTDAYLTAWANQGYDFIIAETRDIPITERSYTTPAGSSPTITLNANTITVDRAKIYVRPENKWQELEVIGLEDLISMDPDWEDADVNVPRFLVRMGTFSARLYPPPNTSIESQATSLKTYGLEKPTSLAAGSDVPDLPVIMHNLFPHYMAYRAFSFMENGERATSELRLFRALLKDLRQLAQKFSDQRVRMKFRHVED